MDYLKKILRLQFKNVSIGYKKVLITIPDLHLNSGKLYSLFGKNGIGKTTLFQTLLKIIDPKSGEILLNEENLSNLKNNAEKIAFVPSKFDGIQHLSVYDFIALGRAPFTNFLGRLKKEDHEIIEQAIEILGINHLKNEDTSKLSDGERQLAAIAKAIAQECKIILLDEPTAFLDYGNKIKVLEILQKLASTKGICIIQSSHDIDLSLEFSEELLLIHAEEKTLKLFQRTELSKNEILSYTFGL